MRFLLALALALPFFLWHVVNNARAGAISVA